MYHRRNIMLAIFGLLLTLIGGFGLFVSIFMAQHSVGTLFTSPNISLALFFAVSLIGCILTIIGFQKDPCELDNARLDLTRAIKHYDHLYVKENGCHLTEFTIVDHWKFAMKNDINTIPKPSDVQRKANEDYERKIIEKGKTKV